MHLDGETLTVDQLATAAYQNTPVEVFPEQAARVKASRDLLDGFVKSGRIIYGVTTAVGGFVNYLIPEELAEQLQNNILRGVATNIGDDLADVYVRAAMLCRINSRITRMPLPFVSATFASCSTAAILGLRVSDPGSPSWSSDLSE